MRVKIRGPGELCFCSIEREGKRFEEEVMKCPVLGG